MPATPAIFRRAVLRWYAANRRDLPWRRTTDPWKILLSEVMLQQTQVPRVIQKYEEFTRRWPTPAAMAAASLGEVLTAWSGLGYNRRGRNLKAAADAITAAGGVMPTTVEGLEALPGVGRYTARAVASFAYNQHVALYDTNVRRIALRVFFGGEFARRDPSEAALEATLAAALPPGRSAEWHNALMDFGSAVCVSRQPACATCPLRGACKAAPHFLKGRVPPRRLVRAQPKFEGSRRQARGAVLRLLAAAGAKGLPLAALVVALNRPDAAEIIAGLAKEGMVARRRSRVTLP